MVSPFGHLAIVVEYITTLKPKLPRKFHSSGELSRRSEWLVETPHS